MKDRWTFRDVRPDSELTAEENNDKVHVLYETARYLTHELHQVIANDRNRDSRNEKIDLLSECLKDIGSQIASAKDAYI